MLYPSIDRLADLADSKYTLVVAAAKRARKLQDGAKAHAQVHSNKNVSIALKEIGTGKLTLTHIEER